MSKKYYLEQFESKLVELFSEIHEKGLSDYINTANKKRNIKSILKHYVEVLEPHSALISEMDETLFTDMSLKPIKGLSLWKLWKSGDLDDEDKHAIWKYMQVLYLLGTMYVGDKEAKKDVDFEKMVKDITENITEDDINEMKNKFQNIDTDKIVSDLDNLTGGNDLFKKIVGDITEELQNMDMSPSGEGNSLEGLLGGLLGGDGEGNPLEGLLGGLLGGSGEGNPLEGLLGGLLGGGGEDNPLGEMLSNMPALDEISRVAGNVMSKVQNRIDSGEIDQEQLAETTEKMIGDLQKNFMESLKKE